MADWVLGRSGSDIAAAIKDGEIEATAGCGGPVIDIQLAEPAAHVWPIDAIEEAMGRGAARVPRYVVATLQYLAEQNRESTDALLTHELHGLANAHPTRPGQNTSGGLPAARFIVTDLATALRRHPERHRQIEDRVDGGAVQRAGGELPLLDGVEG